MHPETATPINELDQIVVQITDSYYQRLSHVAIVRDAGIGLSVIGAETPYLPVNGGSVTATMCSARAAMTVRGKVLLRGKKVRPEDYLAHWRAVEPCTAETLFARHGITLGAHIQFVMDAEKPDRWYYQISKDAADCFEEFIKRYPPDHNHHAFITLNTETALHDVMAFSSNRAREAHGNYLPLSRISIVAYEDDATFDDNAFFMSAKQPALV